jgi:hypothetical protein
MLGSACVGRYLIEALYLDVLVKDVLITALRTDVENQVADFQNVKYYLQCLHFNWPHPDSPPPRGYLGAHSKC